MSKLKQKNEGFTLVELIVAISILAIYVGTVTGLIITNSRLAQRTRDLATTNSFVENKIEALRSAGYLSLSDGATDITSELPSELRSPRTASQTISSVSTSVKQIAISLTYNDVGTQRTYNYKTYVGELGVGQY
jgi:prepilin-type N-terminal cleavage/methylation domain-containing protein